MKKKQLARMNPERASTAAQKQKMKRRGWLKNGNPPGDFTKAPRCGAKTRRGTRCQCPAMPNGRCRLHGGLSTGSPQKQTIWPCRHGSVIQRGRTRVQTAPSMFVRRPPASPCRFRQAGFGSAPVGSAKNPTDSLGPIQNLRRC